MSPASANVVVSVRNLATLVSAHPALARHLRLGTKYLLPPAPYRIRRPRPSVASTERRQLPRAVRVKTTTEAINEEKHNKFVGRRVVARL